MVENITDGVADEAGGRRALAARRGPRRGCRGIALRQLLPLGPRGSLSQALAAGHGRVGIATFDQARDFEPSRVGALSIEKAAIEIVGLDQEDQDIDIALRSRARCATP